MDREAGPRSAFLTPPLFLRALNRALSRPPVWVTCTAIPLVLGLAAALPWLRWFEGALEHRYAPQDLIASLDETFRFDQRKALETLNASTAAGGAVLALLAMLGGVYCAGGWLTVLLEPTHGHSLQRFCSGGARFWWRYLRVMLITLLVLSFSGWLLHGMPWQKFVLELGFGLREGKLEDLTSERTAVAIGWAQDGLYALVFGLVMTWGDYTRTRLALQDASSAVWAGLCSFWLLLRHPLRSLRPAAMLLVVEVAFIALVGAGSDDLNQHLPADAGRPQVALLLALGAFALAWRAIVRGARYAAAVEISRELVPPTSKPDPWAKGVGAPGGPQYPIDGDEFGVSV